MTDAKPEEINLSTKAENAGGTINDDNPGNNESTSTNIIDKDLNAEGIQEIIELPNDILCAFFLIKQKGIWDEYTCLGKIGVVFSVILPYFIQLYAGAVLFSDINYREDLFNNAEFKGSSLVYNLLALTVLFIYMLRDLSSLYSSLWKYIRFVEKEMAKGRDATSLGNELKKLKFGSALKGTFNKSKEMLGKELGFTFVKIMAFLIVGLYFILLSYSIVQISGNETIIDKLEVSVSVFILLEIDDWACELFILNNGILDEDDFDVTITNDDDVTESNIIKAQQTRLLCTELILIIAVLGIWGVSVAFEVLKI